MGIMQATLFDTWTETIAPAPIEPQPAPVVVDAEYYRAHSHDYNWQGYTADMPDAKARAAFIAKHGHEPDVVLRVPGAVLVGPLRGRP